MMELVADKIKIFKQELFRSCLKSRDHQRKYLNLSKEQLIMGVLKMIKLLEECWVVRRIGLTMIRQLKRRIKIIWLHSNLYLMGLVIRIHRFFQGSILRLLECKLGYLIVKIVI